MPDILSRWGLLRVRLYSLLAAGAFLCSELGKQYEAAFNQLPLLDNREVTCSSKSYG